MFKLIALLFAMTGGQPADKPSLVIEIKPGFETREACFGFLKTEEGSKAKKAIEAMADEIEGDVSIRAVCVRSGKPDDDDDGKI
jgi:hypothetical protein